MQGTASANIYIGVKGTSSTPAKVQIDVYNDLFPGSVMGQVTEHSPFTRI